MTTSSVKMTIMSLNLLHTPINPLISDYLASIYLYHMMALYARVVTIKTKSCIYLQFNVTKYQNHF